MSINQVKGRSGHLLEIDSRGTLPVNIISFQSHIQARFTLDFSGKVSGSMAENANRAITFIGAPNADIEQGSEIGDPGYAKINALDGDVWSNSAVATGNYPQLRVPFNLASNLYINGVLSYLSINAFEDAMRHAKLTVVCNGSGSNDGVAANGVVVEKWNGSEWVNIGTNAAADLDFIIYEWDNPTLADIEGLIINIRPRYGADEANSIESVLNIDAVYLEIDYEYDTSLKLTPDGKLPVDATVSVQAEVTDAKIKGSTDGGTTFVPVKVKEDGTLMVEVSGVPEVRINGSVGPLLTAISRGIYTSSKSIMINMSGINARGVIINLELFGLTGTFGEGEGVALTATFHNSSGSNIRNYGVRASKRISIGGCHQSIMIYPGLSAGALVVEGMDASSLMVSGALLPITNYLTIGASINGTFETGQGMDLTVRYRWLY